MNHVSLIRQYTKARVYQGHFFSYSLDYDDFKEKQFSSFVQTKLNDQMDSNKAE